MGGFRPCARDCVQTVHLGIGNASVDESLEGLEVGLTGHSRKPTHYAPKPPAVHGEMIESRLSGDQPETAGGLSQ